MDLIPKPAQVLKAVNNLATKLAYGGVADLRLMPRTLIDEGPRREVYHYRVDKSIGSSGDPVLLVMPLAAPSLCYDLRRGCSLVEHFVNGGRPTYLVEYGDISFKDRNLGIEHWVSEVLPETIKKVSEHSQGKKVHLVAWSLGGIFSLFAAAANQRLPIASIAVLGSPFDVAKVPILAPIRPLLEIPGGLALVTRAYRMAGGTPIPLVKGAFQIASIEKILTKPLVTLQHLDDAEFLAQLEAVDRFSENMTAYPGRTFGQLYHRMVKGNQLKSGELDLAGKKLSLAKVKNPVIVFAGNTDGIAPINAVRAVLPLLKNSKQVRFEIVPGGHLGMLTGRAARNTTWKVLDEWLDENQIPAPARKPRKSTSAKSRQLA